MDVQVLTGKGRCMVANRTVPAGSELLREAPLVLSSPAARPQQWVHLNSSHEDNPFPLDPEWYLAAASIVLAASGDPSTAARIADKCKIDPLAAATICGTDLDMLRAMEALDLHGLVTVEDFSIAVATMRVNGFRLPGEQASMGLFDQASLFSHSCCPTAEFDFTDHKSIVVRSIKDLVLGEEICISYLPTSVLRQSTEIRRLKLEDHLFTCQCARCQWPVDLCRGFCCSRSGCTGTCFMPGGTTCSDEGMPTASLPCHLCGNILDGKALETALDFEAEYGFVVEYGTMFQDFNTAKGLKADAIRVFSQHWIVLAIMQALETHHLSKKAQSEARDCRDTIACLHAVAFEPWPWLQR